MKKTITTETTKRELITIMTQAFYGNRTCTEIHPEDIDRFILGYLDDSLKMDEPIDRTIIKLPNTDNLVLIYNKYQEEESLCEKERYYQEKKYVFKPLALIPELNLEIYSRCIVCRMDEQGNLQSLQNDDYKKFIHYLAK